MLKMLFCNKIEISCSEKPCGANATCTVTTTGYFCQCPSGHHGLNCLESKLCLILRASC